MDTKDIVKAHGDSEFSAKLAGLSYEMDDVKGWSRTKTGKKTFSYKDVHGKEISDEKALARINSLVIPPAWKNVWISSKTKGHLQATGVDIKGIKQYRYHARWSAFRDALKFERLSSFAESLPKLRAEIRKQLDVKTEVPTREKAVAAALDLVDLLAIRIGNDEYAEENKTFGVTTLKNQHVDVHGDIIELSFIGKSHQAQDFELRNKKLAAVIKEELEIPGARLFQYLDDQHRKHPLTSSEVNAFIKQVTEGDFTAKDFRTWSATAEAYKLMKEGCSCFEEKDRNEKGYKKSLKKIITCVAEKLGNTVSVCRAYYVHADLQEAYQAGKFEALAGKISRSKKHAYAAGLKGHEAELKEMLGFLSKERMKKIKTAH